MFHYRFANTTQVLLLLLLLCIFTWYNWRTWKNKPNTTHIPYLLTAVMGQLLTVMLSVGTIVEDSYYGTKALKLPSNFATCHATLVETTWITCGSTLRCKGVKMKEYPQVSTVKKRGYELILTWRFGAYTKDLHHVSVFQVLHILVVWSSTIIVR